METINNGTFAHGYILSKLNVTSILVYISKCGYVVVTGSLINLRYLLFK